MTRRLWFRLLVAFIVVAVVGGLAAYIVGTVVGHDAVRQGLRLGQGAGRSRGPSSETTTAFDQALSEALLWGVLAAVVIGVILAFVFARQLARPAEAMQDGARRMRRGDYSVRVPVGGPAEIAALGDDINQLAGKLEAVEERRTRLLSELAHELRSPLTAIDGYVEGLLDGVFEPDPRIFASIGEETARLHRLAGDLTTVARAEEGAIDYSWSDVDLNGVAVGVVSRLEPQFVASEVQLSARVPETATMVRGDADRLDQVLTNLVGNALGHTSSGGEVVVTVRAIDEWAEIVVQDDGGGIDEVEIERIFERFYRAPGTSRHGSGLGLTIARAVVEAHGGSVEAASPGPGQGATFTVAIPRAESR